MSYKPRIRWIKRLGFFVVATTRRAPVFIGPFETFGEAYRYSVA